MSILGSMFPPAELSGFLASSFYLIGLVTAVVVLYKHLRPSPNAVAITQQPVRVTPEIRLATHEELTAVRVRVDKLEDNHRALLQAGQDRGDMLRQEITRSSEAIHARIDDVLKAVSHLEGQMEGCRR